ncbi:MULTISPECIES: S41 family peptidase [Bacteroidales]|uniref:S41 family peptidase n=1 Tax=uncultured Parabacteroides sp. TaxID=512312 RepID=UPI0025927657|nr:MULTISPECIES: S41 family peptidase [Bacteroidales]
MKKILGCLIFIIGIWSYLSAQIKEYSQGSEFKECPMTRSVLNNLEVLCRVWGFVKYHHPVFSDSTASADYELFKLLPQIAVAEKWERNQILSDWIVSLGSFRQDRKGYVRMLDTMNYEMTADLEWLDDNELLGKKMSRTLRKLRFAERDSNYYLQRKFQGGRYVFIHENKYQNSPMAWNPDCGYRLLAFFRYWNFVEYFYPYKRLTDRRWDEMLSVYLPEIIATHGVGFRNLMFRINTELCDMHAFSVNPNLGILGGSKTVPADTRFVENRLIVVSPDRYTPLGMNCFRTADEILSINGFSIDSLKRFMKANFSLSNEACLQSRLAQFCWYTNADTMAVTFCRENNVQDTLIQTQIPVKEYTDRKYRMIVDTLSSHLFADSIGYISGGNFHLKDLDGVMSKFCHTKGLIIDLRSYPSEPIMFIFSKLSNKLKPYMEVSRPCYTLPGYFYWEKTKEWSDPEQDYYKGKVVVLVDENTFSQGETTVLVLQAIPGITVIGSRTAGTNGDVHSLPLIGYIPASFSGYGIRYPDGTPTQRVGVRIDEIVEPTIEGVKAGRDEVLERAIEIINE